MAQKQPRLCQSALSYAKHKLASRVAARLPAWNRGHKRRNEQFDLTFFAPILSIIASLAGLVNNLLRLQSFESEGVAPAIIVKHSMHRAACSNYNVILFCKAKSIHNVNELLGIENTQKIFRGSCTLTITFPFWGLPPSPFVRRLADAKRAEHRVTLQ